MKPTNRDLIIFNAAATEYLEMFDPEARPKTKLGYACRRVMTQTDLALSTYNENLEDLRVKNCLTEPGDKDGKRGRILRDAKGNYEFDPDGTEAFNNAHREMLGAEAKFPGGVFDPYYATAVPDDIPYGLFDAMVGFTISEKMAGQIMADPGQAVADQATAAGSEATPDN